MGGCLLYLCPGEEQGTGRPCAAEGAAGVPRTSAGNWPPLSAGPRRPIQPQEPESSFPADSTRKEEGLLTRLES